MGMERAQGLMVVAEHPWWGMRSRARTQQLLRYGPDPSGKCVGLQLRQHGAFGTGGRLGLVVLIQRGKRQPAACSSACKQTSCRLPCPARAHPIRNAHTRACAPGCACCRRARPFLHGCVLAGPSAHAQTHACGATGACICGATGPCGAPDAQSCVCAAQWRLRVLRCVCSVACALLRDRCVCSGA